MTHVLQHPPALAVLAAYAVFLLIRPQAQLLVLPRLGRQGPPPEACRWCSGTGTRFRLGARVVHRGAALAMRYAADRLRDRRD